MKYTLTAKLLPPTPNPPTNTDKPPDDEESGTLASENTQSYDNQQDYISVTLAWRNGKEVTARTNRKKFHDIVQVCSDIWQSDNRSESQVKKVGSKIAELLIGESYQASLNENSTDSVLDSVTSAMTPFAVLKARLKMPSKLDHIQIVTEDDVLQEIPWELLVIDDLYISLLDGVRLFRLHEPDKDHTTREGTIDLRILNVNMSNTQLAIGERPCGPINAIDPPEEFVLQSLSGTNITSATIQRALEARQTTVFHFAGHGGLLENERPALCVSTGKRLSGMPEYQVAFMEPFHLAAYLSNNDELVFDTPLIVCACCQSGIGSRATSFGIDLVDKGASAVVGMQAEVHDESANCFTRALYSALNNENTIVSAVAAARRRVATLDDPKCRLDWWIPTLHCTHMNLIFERKAAKSTAKRTSALLQDRARGLREQGDYKAALETFTELMRRQRRELSNDDLGTLETLNTIAISYRDIGEVDEALKIDRQLLRKQQLLLGAAHEDVLATRRRIAINLTELGAEPDMRKALTQEYEILEQQKSNENVAETDILPTRAYISDLLTRVADYQDALDIEMTLLQDRQTLLGSDHIDTLRSRSNVAFLHRKLEDYDNALEMEESLITDRERILGPDHPDTLTSRNNKAASLWKLGRYHESCEMDQRLLQDRERLLGPDHFDTLDSRKNLAVSLWEMGEHRKSLDLETELLDDQRRILRPDHQVTLKTANNLAESLREFGRLSEALELLTYVLEVRKRTPGERHPDTLITRDDIAIVYRHLGRFDEAVKLHEDVAEVRATLTDPDVDSELLYADEKAIALRGLGRYDEALSAHKDVEARRLDFQGPDHPDLLDTRHHMSIVLRKLGRLDEASLLQRSVLESRQRLLGDQHPKALLSEYQFAKTLTRLGRSESALDLLRDVFERQRTRLGDDHPSVFRSRHQIAITQSTLGKFGEML